MLDPYIRRAQVTRVIDGDTLRLKIDLGWNVSVEKNVRLLRVNAPEMQLATKAAGENARDYVRAWVWLRASGGVVWPFIIRSEKDDAFGRYLVELWGFSTLGEESDNLSDDLLASGHATPFVK